MTVPRGSRRGCLLGKEWLFLSASNKLLEAIGHSCQSCFSGHRFLGSGFVRTPCPAGYRCVIATAVTAGTRTIRASFRLCETTLADHDFAAWIEGDLPAITCRTFHRVGEKLIEIERLLRAELF